MQVNDNDSLKTVVFKNHPILNDAASKKAGRAIYDDIEVCEIRLAANKQTIGVFPAHEMAEWAVDSITGDRTEQTYAMKYNTQYLAFKNGDAQAQSGTPLEALPFLTTGKRLEFKALNIHTAEALAALDGHNLKMLGMSGRAFKDQAQAFIDNASDNALDQRLVDVVSSQDAKIAELEARIAALSNDPLDHDHDGHKGGAAAAVDDDADDDGDAGTSPFDTFEDEDIKNWLKEASPDLKIDARWSRKTLLSKADEVNAALAAKKAGN